MSSIVVGVDQSESAPAVAAVGDRFASALGLELLLVHSLDGSERGSEFLDEADPRRGVGSRRCVVVGDPVETLPAVADQDDAVLLVIGTGTRRAMREIFRRSRASLIARAASQPVVMVSPAAAVRERSARQTAPSAIVCAIDPSPEARRVADLAGALAAATLMRLVLVHAPSREGAVQELFPVHDCEIVTREVEGRPSDWLEAIGAEEDAALAVLDGREHRSRSIPAWASRPVMLVKPATAPEASEGLANVRSSMTARP